MIVSLLVVAALASGTGRQHYISKSLTETRSALDQTLLDLPSARFREVHVTAGAVCGYVNAKNQMGAFVGWRHFAYNTLERQLVLADADGIVAGEGSFHYCDVEENTDLDFGSGFAGRLGNR